MSPDRDGARPPGPADPPRPGARWAVALAPVVLAGSAWLSAAAGRRGLFAFDQSILFDAGHRILSGQTPFEDFVLPFGPVAPALQAGLFALFGLDWAGYLAGAALGNALAAGLAMALLALLLPERPALWILGGVLTGVWFYPPSGTPWFDQTAFLFVLAATVLLLPAALAHARPGGAEGAGGRGLLSGGAAAAGACLVLTVLAKQNAGIAVLPLFALLLAVPVIRRGRTGLRVAFAFVGGAAGASLLFGLWLVLAADPELFFRHVVEIPAAEGVRRLLGSPPALVAFHRLGLAPPAARAVLGASALFAVGAGAVSWLRSGKGGGHGLGGAAVAAGLFLAQHLFTVTSFNQPEISAPFTGLLPPLAAGLVLRALDRSDRDASRFRAVIRWSTVAAVAGASLLLGVVGWRAGFERPAQDLFANGASFERPVRVPALEPLLWGRPTVLDNQPAVSGVAVEAEDLEALVSALEARPGRFFVFPDWTLLYGLLGRPAPQPLLWFHAGLTYPAGGAPDLDRWIVDSLERARVETVVLERVSWFGTEARLADFPRLARHLERCFEEDRRIGIFEIERRRAGCPTGAPPPLRRPVRAAPGAE